MDKETIKRRIAEAKAEEDYLYQVIAFHHIRIKLIGASNLPIPEKVKLIEELLSTAEEAFLENIMEIEGSDDAPEKKIEQLEDITSCLLNPNGRFLSNKEYEKSYEPYIEELKDKYELETA